MVRKSALQALVFGLQSSILRSDGCQYPLLLLAMSSKVKEPLDQKFEHAFNHIVRPDVLKLYDGVVLECSGSHLTT